MAKQLTSDEFIKALQQQKAFLDKVNQAIDKKLEGLAPTSSKKLKKSMRKQQAKVNAVRQRVSDHLSKMQNAAQLYDSASYYPDPPMRDIKQNEQLKSMNRIHKQHIKGGLRRKSVQRKVSDLQSFADKYLSEEMKIISNTQPSTSVRSTSPLPSSGSHTAIARSTPSSQSNWMRRAPHHPQQSGSATEQYGSVSRVQSSVQYDSALPQNPGIEYGRLSTVRNKGQQPTQFDRLKAAASKQQKAAAKHMSSHHQKLPKFGN